MTNRFFRTSPEIYTATRAALDAAFGHPNQYADTCLPPVEDAPSDDQGRVYVAVLESMFAWPTVQGQVAALISQGLVEELTEAEFLAALPQPENPL